MSKGIIYIAIGDKYFDMAVKSAKSVIANYHGNCPPILIFTEWGGHISIPGIELRELLFAPDACPDIQTAYLKTNLNRLSPFDKTLYLDCDTKIVGDISDIWTYCTPTIAVAPAFNPLIQGFDYTGLSEELETSRFLNLSNKWEQYNTGIFLFDKSIETDNLFRFWQSEWSKFYNHENMAFSRLVAFGFSIVELPAIYNDFYPNKSSDSKIVHYIGWYKKYLDV